MSSPTKRGISPPKPTRNSARPSLESTASSSAWETLDSSTSSVSSQISQNSSPQRPALNRDSRPTSAIYLGGNDIARRHAADHDNRQQNGVEPKKPSPVFSVASGFASVKVGLGSPHLDFSRDWGVGARKREGSSDSAPLSQGSSGDGRHGSAGIRGKERANKMVDKVSGLPSPPRTESDIAPPVLAKSGSSTSTSTVASRAKCGSPTKTPASLPKSTRRTSSTGSAHLLSRHDSSQSISSPTSSRAESPRLRTTGLRLKSSPSISRTSSTSSNLVVSPGSRQHASDGFAKRASSDLSRHSSRSSGIREGGNRNLSPKRKQIQSLDLSRSTSSSRISSPERTATIKLPLLDDDDDEMDKDNTEPRRQPISPRKSPGTDLDDRIREAEERALQASSSRRSRFNNVEVETPVRGTIRRHDSYSRAQVSPLASTSTSTLRRSATLSSASALTTGERASDLPSKRHNHAREHHDIAEDPEERDMSGGSGSSRRRKALPADFRQGGLFTPSPPKPRVDHSTNEPPQSARSSKLRHFIDSPTDYPTSSHAPSRLSSTSRLSRNFDQVPSPDRPRFDGLERSASLAGSRNGETSGYSQRQWSQSISGLPRMGEGLDHRGLPRYRPDTAIGGGDRDRRLQRGSHESGLTETSIRRGQSMLISDRDLAAASRLRISSLAPGDSISAVGADSDRGDSKDPLDVVRRLEQQRAESRRRWHDIPRSSTSMSGMRDVYNAAPRTAPIERITGRRSVDQAESPSVGRGSSRLSMRGPVTDPRPMRNSTSLGGRASANATLETGNASTEHGQLLFEAFRGLQSRMGDIVQLQPDLIRTIHSATRSTEAINTSLRNALDLAAQIAIDAELGDPERVREEYSRLAILLREAGRTSDQNIRDMTRVMLDLPKLLHQVGKNVDTPGSMSAGSSRGLRRSESASLAFDPIKLGPGSEERVRRWQPTSPIHSNGIERSPFQQGRWSLDTPRRDADTLRPATSIGETTSPLSRYSGRERSGGSTVASLMSRVRNMTPRKAPSSPKPYLPSIQQSPPQPQLDNSSPSTHSDEHSSVRSLPRSPERTPLRNVLKKKASTASTHTIKGSTFFPTVSRGGTTTAISQVTAGDPSPGGSKRDNKHKHSGKAMSIRSFVTDEPNSPMSRYGFNQQRERTYSNSLDQPLRENENDGSPKRQERQEEDEYFSAESYSSHSPKRHEHDRDHEQGREHTEPEPESSDAVSFLEQSLVEAAKMRERKYEREQVAIRERLGVTDPALREGDLDRRPSLSDRFKALRNGKGGVRAEG